MFETISTDVLPLDAIRMKLMEVNWNFVDIEFPPVESSLYPSSEASPIKQKVVWKRPKDFMVVDKKKGLNAPDVFDKKIEPNDIK